MLVKTTHLRQTKASSGVSKPLWLAPARQALPRLSHPQTAHRTEPRVKTAASRCARGHTQPTAISRIQGSSLCARASPRASPSSVDRGWLSPSPRAEKTQIPHDDGYEWPWCPPDSPLPFSFWFN